jgi:hypothetical protein
MLLQNEKLMYEIAQENKRLSEPLSKALKEVEALRQALANYDKDKLSLAQTKVCVDAYRGTGHCCTRSHNPHAAGFKARLCPTTPLTARPGVSRGNTFQIHIP